MDGSTYVTLTRQSGLKSELQSIAANIANLSTTGYRREGLIFAEHVTRTGANDPSISMARAGARHIDLTQGPISPTGGQFDFAIEGPGFFLLETATGQMLTRAGSFAPDAGGELVTPDGARLLDAGGAPIFVPPDARSISLAGDGTLVADDRPLTQVGLWQPVDPMTLSRRAGARFASDGGFEPAFDGRILQGFVEDSNVDPISEIARMIEVQRAYEMGQKFLSHEDERVRAVVRTLGK